MMVLPLTRQPISWQITFLSAIAEVGLFAGILLHIFQGFLLWSQNVAARPVRYAKNDAGKNSTWYSRSMGLLGTLLLIFLLLHVSGFLG
jgi:succinate dehydrogenase / fumarate reductase cytochrome b subunit